LSSRVWPSGGGALESPRWFCLTTRIAGTSQVRRDQESRPSLRRKGREGTEFNSNKDRAEYKKGILERSSSPVAELPRLTTTWGRSWSRRGPTILYIQPLHNIGTGSGLPIPVTLQETSDDPFPPRGVQRAGLDERAVSGRPSPSRPPTSACGRA